MELPAQSSRRDAGGIGPFARLSVLVVGVFLVGHVVWLCLERGPMLWDDAHYALAALRMLDGLSEGGVSGFFENFLRASGPKAPFLSAATVPLLLVFGRESPWPFAAAVLSGFVVACVYAFRLARLLAGEFAGFVAVLLLSTMPAVEGLSRQYMVEVPLLATVLAWHFHLLRSDFLTHASGAWSLGILAGVGLLLKVTFPLFVIGSVGVLLGVQARRLGPRWPAFRTAVVAGTAAILALFFLAVLSRHAAGFMGAAFAALLGYWVVEARGKGVPTEARRVLAVAVVGFAIAGSWYAVNFALFVRFAWNTSFGSLARHYDLPLFDYVAQIASYGPSNLQIFFLAAALVASARLRGKRTLSEGPASTSVSLPSSWRWTLVLWLVAPLVVFLLSKDRLYRLLLPCLAPVPLFGGILAANLRRMCPRVTHLGVVAYALLATALQGAFSFELPPRGRLALGPWVLWGTILGWDQRNPSPVPWPHGRIARAASVLVRDREANGALLLFDTHALNSINLQLEAVRGRLDVTFSGPKDSRGFAEMARSLEQSPLLLVKEGGERGPDWAEGVGRASLDYFRSTSFEGWNRVHEISLPDGGLLLFYLRVPTADAFERPDIVPCRVNFGDRLALTDLGVRREGNAIVVRSAWDVLEDLVEDYAVFLHFTDRSGRLYPRDFALSRRGHGTTGWRRGMRFLDVRQIPIDPEIQEAASLSIGVYERTTLTTLPVESSTEPLREDGRGILLR